VATQREAAPGEVQLDLRARVRRQARAEVAQIAFDLFAERGFEATTATEAAEAAGISRASFFRLFSSKEEAVFVAQEVIGEEIAQDLAERPAEEPPWRALRQAFLVATSRYLDDLGSALARARLAIETPTLRGRQLELQARWADAIEPVLVARVGARSGTRVWRVTSLAAISAFDAAVTEWGESNGEKKLTELIGKTFEIYAGLGELD
jgi:AcrR family transcriptional regulator